MVFVNQYYDFYHFKIPQKISDTVNFEITSRNLKRQKRALRK